MDQLLKLLDSPLFCYVSGSLAMAACCLLNFLGERRKFTKHEWQTIIICLPFMNSIIVAVIVLECMSIYTGNPIIIGRRKS